MSHLCRYLLRALRHSAGVYRQGTMKLSGSMIVLALSFLAIVTIVSASHSFSYPIAWDNTSSNVINTGLVRKQLVVNIEDVIEDEYGNRFIITLTDPFDDMEDEKYGKKK
ncbi:uncharacterized protein LOC124354402 [Homalodisca vitripennis]|uniref:uncharacterized protein LOC124354402 n=1 Tax=Homalodisca vitripennis TaxID=197043 RepID=UPI001EE9C55C|nr:uncharacterized protein LOC124354402 [Homalodisca vitripennis]